MTFTSPTRLPIPFYAFCFLVWFGYLYLLHKSKNEILKGLPFLFVSVGLAYALLEKGENYYLRLITFSLPTLPLYAVQGFPPILIVIMGGSYFYLHGSYSHYLSAFYEPITSTYMIPAQSIHNVLKGYRVALALEMVCLMIYLIVVQRLWKKYMQAKFNLEEANKKLESANQDLEEANYQLQAADQLAKHVSELDCLNKQLQNALQSQDLFVASVSHELRNPLNVMLGSLDLLEPYTKDNSQLQLLKTCKLCGDALLNLINNLLDVAKINADKLEINEFATDMSSFFEELWAYTRVGLDKKDLSGSLIIERHLPLWLNVDAHRLQQIMNNLVGNAIKFTDKGSVKITFSWAEGKKVTSCCSFQKIEQKSQEELRITRRRSSVESCFLDFADLLEGDRQDAYPSRTPHIFNNFFYFEHSAPVREKLKKDLKSDTHKGIGTLKISIVDTGCGISEEAQKQLFKPFVQGDRSVTRKFGGTGLGLYIVKKLLAKMDGTIKLDSSKDSGTHIEVTIPVRYAKKPSDDTSITIMASSQSLNATESMSSMNSIPVEKSPTKWVLIVDDDPFNQTLLKQYFKKFNFSFDVASNGLEGYQMYKGNMGKYSLITMDIQMPVMDGITACKKIRQYETEKGKEKVPIAIITANCSEDERTACLDSKEIEASYFFRKPFRLADCKLCVERVI